jgi:protein-disulfide isomerase
VTETRRQRLWLLGASAVVVVAIVVIALAIGRAGGGTAGTTTGTPAGIAATRALFAGIPQRGVELGARHAPVTVIEYADLQCPFCGKSARERWPDVVRRFVRPGRAKLVFRNLAFLGPDSLDGARMATAAALQNRMWQFVDLVYRNQGEEGTGWITDAYLRRVAAGAGLDVRTALAQRRSAAVLTLLSEAKAMADAAGVRATPAFQITRAGRAPVALSGDADVASAIQDALRRP